MPGAIVHFVLDMEISCWRGRSSTGALGLLEMSTTGHGMECMHLVFFLPAWFLRLRGNMVASFLIRVSMTYRALGG